MKVPEIKLDPVEFLVSRRFPGWPERYYPEDRFAGPGVGSSGWGLSSTGSDPAPAEVAGAEAYYAELKGLQPRELLSLVRVEKLKQTTEALAKSEATEADRFFNQRSANVDLGYWSEFSYWSVEEAIALSFGRDPKVVSFDSVKDFVGRSPFADEYIARRELALRDVESGSLSERMTPLQFNRWARSKSSLVPEVELPSKSQPGNATSNMRNQSLCQSWLESEMRASRTPPSPKDAYRVEAVKRWPGLGRNAFLRAWANAIQVTESAGWARAGTKKKKSLQ